MGNCQAAEAATVVIQHPGNKVERIYWSISANEVMSSNPGHYMALVITSPTERTHNGLPVKQLKLLRPGDTLLLGQVYRLISFEDVLKEFAAKKCVKLGKLLRESGGLVLDSKKISVDPSAVNNKPRLVKGIPAKMEHEISTWKQQQQWAQKCGKTSWWWGAMETSLTEYCRDWNLNYTHPLHHKA